MARLEALAGVMAATLLAAPDGYYCGRYDGDLCRVENVTQRIVDTDHLQPAALRRR